MTGETSFKLKEIKCTELVNLEGKKGLIDPYVSFKYLGQSKKTETREKELNPSYKEVLSFDLSGKELGSEDFLEVSVKDYEKIGSNKLVGKATISLTPLLNSKNGSETLSSVLADKNGRPTTGRVTFRVDYIGPGGNSSSKERNSELEETGEGSEDTLEDDEDPDTMPDGTPIPDGPEGEAMRKEKKATYKRKTRKKHDLPDKLTDFQIRIKIIEGRQLPGININPTVRVILGNETKQTRVKRSTNKPFFDETFFFNFNERPNKLFDDIVTFEVHNSKGLLSECLLGTFQFDVGTIYNESDHAIVRKWLLMTAPEENEKKDDMEGEVKGSSAKPGGPPAGYIKMTAFVLGPGDQIPEKVKTVAIGDDDEDIESNLLRPAGSTLGDATFFVRIYHAEDIPQMDSASFDGIKKLWNGPRKDHVDPYMKFTFAGQKNKTVTKYENNHPEFNQELRVSYKFPSMCERLKLQLYDWDRVGSDDCIGTSFISLSSISGTGEEGFLPCFGPSYLTFYGSTREFTNTPDEYENLNKGHGEGCGYRGRALVEIKTKLGKHVDKVVQDIPANELVSVQTFMRRRKYKLFASFLSANMISEEDGQIEFEVSIGNYGNKLDTDLEPQSSSTPATNPVYDGCAYYFLPWQDSKPCCIVESHWEDIAFRLEPINILEKIIDRIEEGIKVVETSMKGKSPPTETAAFLIALLDQFIADCKVPIPTFEATRNSVNDLDLKLQSIRIHEMENLLKEASTLREQATDVKEAMAMIEGFLNRMRELCIEPQNSLPDVVIWMISGSKRVAYYRIPAHEIMFSKNEKAKGKHCAKNQNLILKFPSSKSDKDDFTIPACVSVILWLGLEANQGDWATNNKMEGQYSVYAETYENQGKPPLLDWTPKVVSRPEFSDSNGKVRLKKDSFIPPNGWKWDDPPDNDWFIDPEIASNYDADAGHKKFMQDAYENESRIPPGNWGKAKPYYTDIKGDEINHRDETELPEGWAWTDDWVIDNNRACDEEGWQYCLEVHSGAWDPTPRRYHLARRRRWVRNRKLEQDPQKLMKKKKEVAKLGEGWEYSPTFGKKYHLKENKFDFVRRRRWHRKMINTKPGAIPLFTICDKNDKVHHIMPRVFLAYDNPHKYQMRVYIYQARDILGLDSEGTSDAYAKICFQDQSQMTRVIYETLCPDFDETLIFDEMYIYGNPKLLAANPPYVIVEFFDKDKVGKDEYLGRSFVQPMVKLVGSKPPAPKLMWFPIMRGDKQCGELLAAVELFLNEGADLPLPPPTKNNRFIVPNGIRPIMTKTAVEILAWGIRNMKKYQLATCTSPSTTFEIGSEIIETDIIKSTKRNPNFLKNVFYKELFLPKDPLYMPPIVIKVRDHRTFGRKPVVGRHVIKSADMVPPPKKEIALTKEAKEAKNKEQVEMDIEEEEPKKKKKKIPVDESLDWWSKYFASIGELDKCGSYLEKDYKLMKVYNSELEEEKDFGGFGDFIKSFPLERGKEDDDEDDNVVGEFKGLFKMYQLPPDQKEPSDARYFTKTIQRKSRPVDCIVRVYIIRGRDFQPKDPNGKADPYVTIELGKQKVSNKENYIPNTVNPFFGAFFELKATIPLTKDLKIRVMDYDFASRNDLIGETTIDLENRYLSQCRATVGLPAEYFIEGPYKWRDVRKPKEILDKLCRIKPQWMSPEQVIVNGELCKLDEYEISEPTDPCAGPPDQRLALHVLNNRNINGFKLVPEHVESRVLRNPLQPNMNQGQLDMFVDIYPIKYGIPGPPIEISPRRPHDYELRVIIWNTADVPPTETSITGDEMSDLYIKGWMAGINNEKQKTDVHYRSMDGEGMFNWRMVFPFKYMPEEKCMVVENKEHFWSIDTTLMKMPPTFSVQVWDSDLFLPEEFIGILELDLSKVVKPKKDAGKCDMKTDETLDLFTAKALKGWWTMFGENDEGEKVAKGKIEMSLEIIPGEEAAQLPAGKGREEPNANPPLDKPSRPETSFLWFTSPWKTLKHIIWRKYKWYFLIGILLLILIAFFVLLFYYLPEGIINSIFGKN